MSPQDNDAGGFGHRAPGTGGERGFSASAGTPGRSGPASAFGGERISPERAGTEKSSADNVGAPNGGANSSTFDDDAVVEAELIEAGTVEPTDTPAVEEDELTVVSRQRDEYLDMVRRVQADFENYKKRMVRQQSDQLDRATENLVVKLLPALDAFALTRAHLNDETAASPEVKALLQAAGLVDDSLTKEGLERIDDAGAPFDPTVHDAVEHAPAPDPTASVAPPGGPTPTPAGPEGPVVADVLRPGYRWKGRVIRPAMVRVRG